MAIRGIGSDGVASEIGALGRHTHSFRVELARLIDSLCRRYGSTETEAHRAVEKAEAAGVVHRLGDMVELT